MPQFLIIKSTGEQEVFDASKLLSSLRKAGASKEQSETVLLHIEREIVSGTTTAEIYHHAFEILRKIAQPIAARYSMKRAIADLGPSGFPFEKFIAEIFRAEGYEALTDQVVRGGCVEHEIDVIAWKGDKLVMVEAKFHNESGLKSDVKVALYVKARSDDIKDQIYEYGGHKQKITSFQLFTNTKFTETAIHYAECKGLSLIGWDYPKNGNLEDLVTELGLHPLTSLMSLSRTEKRSLLDAGFVLCKQVSAQGASLSSFGIPKENIGMILQEIEHLCS